MRDVNFQTCRPSFIINVGTVSNFYEELTQGTILTFYHETSRMSRNFLEILYILKIIYSC